MVVENFMSRWACDITLCVWEIATSTVICEACGTVRVYVLVLTGSSMKINVSCKAILQNNCVTLLAIRH